MSRVCYLSEDPEQAVHWLVDADVIRMPIEISQVLLTAWNRIKPGKFSKVIEYLNTDPWLEWVMQSQENYEELWNYATDIIEEHYHRFGSRHNPQHKHGVHGLVEKLGELPPLPEVPRTEFPLSPELARLAYNAEGIFNGYTHRNVPEWKQ
jgi:hypothetical protein